MLCKNRKRQISSKQQWIDNGDENDETAVANNRCEPKQNQSNSEGAQHLKHPKLLKAA